MSFARPLPRLRNPNARWPLVVGEIGATSLILLCYFFIRGMRPDNVESSVELSLQIVRLEQATGLFHEQAIQAAFIQYAWITEVANFVYAWGHFPVLAAIALWLVIKDPIRFRFVRNVMFASAIVGVVCYWVFPAAPPRLMESLGHDFGFTDTVHSATSNAHYVQPGPLVNDYAALPSFHFGWIALASAAIWVNTTARWARTLALALSAVMLWAIVVTANHYFFDIVLGAAVVSLSWLLVSYLYSEPSGAWVRALRERLRSLVPSAERPRLLRARED